MFHSTALTVALLGAFPASFELDEVVSPAAGDEEAAGDRLRVANAPIAGYQVELLELAFESVTAMPTIPHGKNRARGQESVVAACFELDQPLRALAFAERIDDWRRGTCFADYAYHAARLGARSEALRYAELASGIADDPRDTSAQEWRSDRIRAKVAKVHWFLGQPGRGLEYAAGLGDSELRELAEVRAGNLADSELESWMVSVDESLKELNFDRTRSVLDTLGELYERFYDAPEARERVEAKARSTSSKLPVQVRLELLEEMTEVALNHGDPSKALQLVEESTDILDGLPWRLKDRIPLQARLARLRFWAGDERGARSELDSALAMFEADPASITDIYRADALRPLAEAFHALGDAAMARKVYRRAIDEGFANPNGWPRSVDLAESCCSMARAGFEPDAELWERIRALHGSLGAPW